MDTRRFWRPLLYAPRRGPIADATAHERRLRGDGFGDGFGADLSPLGRSTGGDSAPVLPSVARSELGSSCSFRLRVGGSSPSSGAFQPAFSQSHPLVLALSRPRGTASWPFIPPALRERNRYKSTLVTSPGLRASNMGKGVRRESTASRTHLRGPLLTRVASCTFRSIGPGSALPKL